MFAPAFGVREMATKAYVRQKEDSCEEGKRVSLESLCDLVWFGNTGSEERCWQYAVRVFLLSQGQN